MVVIFSLYNKRTMKVKTGVFYFLMKEMFHDNYFGEKWTLLKKYFTCDVLTCCAAHVCTLFSSTVNP
jgi:hypothetical protein